jgi:hypothetical protein
MNANGIGFASIIVMTLALGIAANIVILSIFSDGTWITEILWQMAKSADPQQSGKCLATGWMVVVKTFGKLDFGFSFQI